MRRAVAWSGITYGYKKLDMSFTRGKPQGQSILAVYEIKLPVVYKFSPTATAGV